MFLHQVDTPYHIISPKCTVRGGIVVSEKRAVQKGAGTLQDMDNPNCNQGNGDKHAAAAANDAWKHLYRPSECQCPHFFSVAQGRATESRSCSKTQSHSLSSALARM